MAKRISLEKMREMGAKIGGRKEGSAEPTPRPKKKKKTVSLKKAAKEPSIPIEEEPPEGPIEEMAWQELVRLAGKRGVHKEGMTKEEVIATLGEAETVVAEVEEVWCYKEEAWQNQPCRL